MNRLMMSRFAIAAQRPNRGWSRYADPSKMGDVDRERSQERRADDEADGQGDGDEFSGPEFDEAVDEIESSGDLGDEGSDEDDL